MATAMSSAEGAAHKGLQLCIETVMAEVDRLLSAEQKATDYRSPDDGVAPDHRPTNACTRSLFWLAVIGGNLILLHAFLFLILKYKNRDAEKQRSYGALIFPRFEIFLVILALPCISQASAALVAGRTPSGVVVGILLLGVVAFILLSLFLFLSVGITFGKLLLYKEVHQEGQQFHWYQELIRVTLGPDLRGPPKYMVSQISGSSLSSSRPGERIIASDDETEDAEAPFIQKLFGILRIYYTMLESMKRDTLGVMVGAYLDNSSSKTPIIVLLSITSFQLFFLVRKKPFIKKRVQLVEIISLCCEVGMFATCLVLSEKESSTTIGIFMLILFLVGFMAQMIGERYALFEQTKQLDTAENSFFIGLKIASIGFLLYFIPQKLIKSKFPVFRCMESTSFPGDSNKSTSETSERRWPKQLREMAKASFSKDGSSAPTDPSSSPMITKGSRSFLQLASLIMYIRCEVVNITVMCLVCPHSQNNISQSRVRGQLPIINSNGRGRDVLYVTIVQLLEELGVRVNGFLLKVAHDSMGEFR
ncbi:hypothetical protein V6N12_020487 [Hibiscus sabdariffa]|uniref:Exocyst complex component Sec10-like alpha-helical bundle domain-containing protein n=1 Tax=Hibiscus sabdariffa TaxID=183260 RepID=A0ABR2CZ19_9ROSI